MTLDAVELVRLPSYVYVKEKSGWIGIGELKVSRHVASCCEAGGVQVTTELVSRRVTLVRSGVTVTYVVSGKFDTAGNATGTLELRQISFDSAGVHYDCTSIPYAWRAKVGS